MSIFKDDNKINRVRFKFLAKVLIPTDDCERNSSDCGRLESNIGNIYMNI